MSFHGPDQYERLGRFYALRAKDGPGVIVTAGCSPDVPGRATLDGFSLESDDLIPRHRVITDAVHAAGDAKIALQLLHFGRESFHGRLVAPSPLRLPGSLFKPTALTSEQIVEVIAAYGQAAARAVAAGYDAIELLFSQGFLIHQFLSPHTNLRTDEWGGDRAGRMKLALKVAAAVRAAVGPAFPVIFRIPCMDLLPNGLSFEDSMDLIEQLSAYQIDLLNVSIGWHESDVPTLAHVVPQAGFAAVAARVKQRFPGQRICVSNRISDLRAGEELLLQGHADMVAMGRPFLADREIVSKFRRGQYEEINPCIACNQDCMDHLFLGQEVGCSVNPDCSSPTEGEAAAPLPAGTRIAVIGGGLAGMSAAFHLRRRGAEVTLFERSARLGGQMQLAAKVPTKSGFSGTIRSLEVRLRKSGVKVLLDHAFTSVDMATARWSHVVLATGTQPNFTSADAGAIPGAEHQGSPQVLGWHEVLAHDLPVAFPVMIYGGGGVACDIAKLLLSRHDTLWHSGQYLRKHDATKLVGDLPHLQEAPREITIAQRSSKKIGYKLGRTTRWITMNELEGKGVQMVRSAQLEGVSRDGVNLRVAGAARLVRARTLILATGQSPQHEALAHELQTRGLRFTVLGAATPGQTEPASISLSIQSGYRFAMESIDALLLGGTCPEDRERAQPTTLAPQSTFA